MKWYNVFPDVPDEFHKSVVRTLNDTRRERSYKNMNAKVLYTALAALVLVIAGGGALVYSGMLGGSEIAAGNAGEDEFAVFDIEVLEDPHVVIHEPDIIVREPALEVPLEMLYTEYLRQRQALLNYSEFDDITAINAETAALMSALSSGYTVSVTDNGTAVNIVDIIGSNGHIWVFLEVIAGEETSYDYEALQSTGLDFIKVDLRFDDVPGSEHFLPGFTMSSMFFNFLAYGYTTDTAYFCIPIELSKSEFVHLKSFDITITNMFSDYIYREGLWEFKDIAPGFTNTVLVTDASFEPAGVNDIVLLSAELCPFRFYMYFAPAEGTSANPFNIDLGVIPAGLIEYKDGTVSKLYWGGTALTRDLMVLFNSDVPIDLSNAAYIHITDVFGREYILSVWKLFETNTVDLITEEQAFTGALEWLYDWWHEPITDERAELVSAELEYFDGYPWYLVRFEFDGYIYETNVDAITGKAARG